MDPAGKAKPRISATTAQALFRAADVVDGAYRFAVLGLGRVDGLSRRCRIEHHDDDRARRHDDHDGARRHDAAHGTTHATTTTHDGHHDDDQRRRPRTATSAEPGTTGATVPTSTSAPAGAGAPPLRRSSGLGRDRLGSRLPGARRAPRRSPPATWPSSSTPTRGAAPLAYTSRSATGLQRPGPGAERQPPRRAGLGPLAARRPDQHRRAGDDAGLQHLLRMDRRPRPGAASVQVVARKPFDPACGSTPPVSWSWTTSFPWARAQSQVSHAALGPVDALRTLPGG